MLIDFVPTTSGLSLSDAPAFKKAPGGAPANVAVGISRLGGSSAFIGKVMHRGFCFFINLTNEFSMLCGTMQHQVFFTCMPHIIVPYLITVILIFFHSFLNFKTN